MCLTLTNRATPYNEGKTRFKLLRKVGDHFVSFYVQEQKWVVGEWNEGREVYRNMSVEGGSPNRHDPSEYNYDHGFHVWPVFSDALAECYSRPGIPEVYLAVVEVDEFMASGTSGWATHNAYADDVLKVETWKKARLLHAELVPDNLDDEFWNKERKPLCA